MLQVLLVTLTVLSVSGCLGQANHHTSVPASPEQWRAFNRQVTFKDGVIHLDAQQGDGVLWLNDPTLANGIIEVDIKGRDVQGQSFVGIAFHASNDSTFDAIYFRPFNFRNEQRRGHAVQYISMPGNDWSALRNKFPGRYEHTVTPIPDPDDWFHARIDINFPFVKVYVNGATTPSLEIEQISDRKQGMVGLWVGNGSEGWFKNLTIENPTK